MPFRGHNLKDIWSIYKKLQNQLNMKQFTLTNVESRDFTPLYTINEDTIAMATSYHNSQNIIINNPDVDIYQLPYEPDGINLGMWFMCRGIGADGSVVKDDSGFENNGQIFGSTSRTAGHVDGLDAATANGTTDYIRVPDDGMINTLGGVTKKGGPGLGPGTLSAATSMSFTCWHKPQDISTTLQSKPRIIACKVDQSSSVQSQTQGWSLWVEQDGTVWFSYRQGNTTRAISFSRVITQLNRFYFIACIITSIGGVTPTVRLYIDGVQSSEATSTTKVPQFPTTEAGLDLFINGTDQGTSIGRVNGATGDIRYWRNKGLVGTEVSAQYANKYTILNIAHVARAGDAFVAVEGTTGGGNPGDPPGTPPDPLVAYSYSALSHSPDSHSIDELNAATPGGMGITGGTGGADPAIPAQLFDSFKPTYWSLTSLNQVNPNSKWKLVNLPGTGGFVKTESYTHPGEQNAANILRLKYGTSTPVLQSNTAKFAEFYARYTIRTITRNDTNQYSAGHFLFKYIDINNFAYLVLRPSNIEIRKVVAGVDSLIATGPTVTNAFQPGSIHTVEMWLNEDGQFIEVVVDNDAAGTKLTIGSHTPGSGSLDTILSAVAPMAFRVSNCDVMIDDILVRPLLSEGWESGSPWSLTTASSISPNGKWKLEVAQGTGGFCRTTTTGGGTNNNILDLAFGTASPVLLSQTTFTNLLMEWQHKTNSQNTTGTTNRAQIIFKWKDSSNYYYFVPHTSGWQIRRVLAGVDTIQVSSTANALADAAVFTTGHYKLLVTNGGLDFELWKNISGVWTSLYREEWGIIKLAATGGTNVDIISDDDNGVLAGAGKIGFKAMNCNIDVAFVNVFPT